MAELYFTTAKAMLATYMQQIALQAQLIETQQKLIETQARLIEATPKTPKDKDVFWHIASDGVLSIEAAQSDELEQVQRFLKWNLEFAEKNVKPYVNPKVYGEVVNQMTRGLPERVAELKTRTEVKDKKDSEVPSGENGKTEKGDRIIQLAFIQDA